MKIHKILAYLFIGGFLAVFVYMIIQVYWKQEEVEPVNATVAEMTTQQPTTAKKEQITLDSPKNLAATAVGNSIHITWKAVKGADGYVVYQRIQGQTEYEDIGVADSNTVFISDNLKRNASYEYKVRAYHKVEEQWIYSEDSKTVVAETAQKGMSTIKNFLKTALQPVGSTMYIWGGGWNQEDTGAGDDATCIGVNPQWQAFAQMQNEKYDYTKTKYQWGNGLDCSGYVGWSVYNILNTKPGEKGYVVKAKDMAKSFADRQFGTYIEKKKVKDYKAGDIMSSACTDCGHVWIVLGQCKDGSVVLMHSTPPGVQIDGTVTPDGDKNSEAVRLAKQYMETYYPQWQKQYPNRCKDNKFLSHYSQMRWDITGKRVMTDPDRYTEKNAEQILKDLFES